MRRPTRREFLKHTACLGAGLSVARLLPGCGTLAIPTPPLARSTDPAKVGVSRGKNLPRMVDEALAAIGGIETVVRPDDVVFIKPNFCSIGLVGGDPISAGDCTKPEIIVAVAEACLQAGAAEVIIGEGGQVREFDWPTLHALSESTNLAAEAQRLKAAYGAEVRLVSLHADTPNWEEIPAPYSGLETIRIPSFVTQADRIISLPVIKTHRFCQTTGALKNFVGITSIYDHGPGMPWRIGLHDAPGGLEQTFLDIVAAIKPDLTVVDGSVCCEGNGPHVLPGSWGDSVDMMDRGGRWMVLASADLVAADATTARIISHDPQQVDHIRMAYDQGLGQMREDLIELVGSDLDVLRVGWVPAEPAGSFGDVLLPGMTMLLS